ncbi:MAG: beta-propeller fold lactonase family protein [bacterium]|nr:beta-propeller fold lactonase family protein [bacterium]
MTRTFACLVCCSLLAIGVVDAATLLVANKSDHTVDLLDPATGESRATLPTGIAPHEVAVSPSGRHAVISNYGTRDHPGSSLTVIDVKSAEVLRTINLGEHQRPHGMVWFSKKRLAVTTEGSAHLLVVDPFEGAIVVEIETAQRVSHMTAVTRKGTRAFVANIRSGSVTAIDLKLQRKLRDIRTGAGAEGIALTPNGRELWVGNRGADTLSIVDPATLEIVATLPCAGVPIRVAMTPDGSRALVSCADTGEVALFDVEQRREIARRKLDLTTVPDAASRLFGDRFGESPVPVGVVVAPAGDRAWVAATQSDVVVVVDTQTLEVLDLLRAGREPDGMAYSKK